MPSTADMIDSWRDRRRPPKPARPRPSRRFRGCTYHRRHRRWVGRFKFHQVTYATAEVDSAVGAAFLRDCLAWHLTGGAIVGGQLNFPHLFILEAAS